MIIEHESTELVNACHPTAALTPGCLVTLKNDDRWAVTRDESIIGIVVSVNMGVLYEWVNVSWSKDPYTVKDFGLAAQVKKLKTKSRKLKSKWSSSPGAFTYCTSDKQRLSEIACEYDVKVEPQDIKKITYVDYGKEIEVERHDGTTVTGKRMR